MSNDDESSMSVPVWICVVGYRVVFIRVWDENAADCADDTFDDAFEWVTLVVGVVDVAGFIGIVANVGIVLTKAKNAKTGQSTNLFFALITDLLKSDKFNEFMSHRLVNQKCLNSCDYLQVLLTQMDGVKGEVSTLYGWSLLWVGLSRCVLPVVVPLVRIWMQ